MLKFFKFLLITLCLLACISARAEVINVKLSCQGSSILVDGTKIENNQSFISISNASVKVSGMLSADGVYQVTEAREDYIFFRSQNNQRLHGSINRMNGQTAVIESYEKELTNDGKGGKAIFFGNCTKAKQLF